MLWTRRRERARARNTIVLVLAMLGGAAAPAGAHAGEPAGGAALGEVVLATALGASGLVGLLALAVAYRKGRARWLERAAAWAERTWREPAWAALPTPVAVVSLLVALLGMYWDISFHIDDGRDPGPLANPAHWLILIGLFGVFAAGALAMFLPRERPGPTAVRILGQWMPVGGVLVFAAAAFALLGFPLDDLWHRLFGQDVTLWGPTHLMLFGGAALTLIGRAVLVVEGARAAHREPSASGERRVVRVQRAALVGGLLIGLSTIQGEFDFGVPQFALVFHPALVMFAAGMALVAARVWAGPGGALLAVALFLVVRGLVSVLVGPVFGQTTPHFPIYLAEAVLVELVARRIPRERPLALGLGAGAAIGTVGLAAEWLWSEAWMPIPWSSALWPEGAVVGLAAALAGGVLGGLTGTALESDALRLPRRAGLAAAGAGLAMAAVVAYGLSTASAPDVRASIATEPLGDGSGRARIEVAFAPAGAVADAQWLNVTAWQGGGLVVSPLEEVRAGVYRATEPVPVTGDWKALVRVHTDRSLRAAPVFLPHDEAIGAREVPASPRVERSLGPEKPLLQREAKDAAGWTWTAAILAVLACFVVMIGLLSWGLARLARTGAAASGSRPPARATPARGARLTRPAAGA